MMTQGYQALTEKEKQTLRLIVRGHDAKSMARHLGLSVHTVNERLRDARRKLEVSSSREAARMVFDAESDRQDAAPQNAADKQIGDAVAAVAGAQPAMPTTGAERDRPRRSILAGAIAMSFILGILALTTVPQAPNEYVAPSTASVSARQAAVESAAREWLRLVDAGQWDASWRATGAAFRKLNTVAVWTDASQQARVPLGAATKRTLLTHNITRAPPQVYDVVTFRTAFADKPGAVETVTLERETGGWKVVAYIID